MKLLNLLGSKKWWDKKHLIRFGIESCELINKEANRLYGECIDATKQVIQEIDDKLSKELSTMQVKVLQDLHEVLVQSLG